MQGNICNDFAQHARECIDFAQNARKYIDFAQHAREYTVYFSHIMQVNILISHSMQRNIQILHNMQGNVQILHSMQFISNNCFHVVVVPLLAVRQLPLILCMLASANIRFQAFSDQLPLICGQLLAISECDIFYYTHSVH